MADEKRAGGAPSRTYVILEEHNFDDGETYYLKVAEVVARNGTNALRKAYQQLKGEEGEAVLLPIPESQWRPTPVAGRQRSGITVTVGA